MKNESPVIFISMVIKGGAPRPLGVGRITSLTFEESDTKSAKLTLAVLNHDLAAFDAPVFRTGMRLIVQWGYFNNLSVPREVVVKSVKGFTTLTVECLDKGSLMNERKRTGTFKGKTRSQVVEEIAKAYGYEAGSLFITETKRQFSTIAYGGKTDGELVMALAKAEGFQFYVDHKGFHWESRDLTQKPVRTFSWGAARSNADAIIDEPSIDVDLTVPRPKVIRSRGIDRQTGKPFDVGASNVETDREGLAPTLEGMEDWSAKLPPTLEDAAAGEVSLEDPGVFGSLFDGLLGESETPELTDDNTIESIDFRDGESTNLLREMEALEAGTQEVSDATSHDATDAKTKVDGRYRKLMETTVKLSFSALGDPSFFGKSVFRFECQAPGAPPCKRLSGNYYAKTVTHEVTPGSYTMKIDAVSDGSNGTAGKKSGAAVNDKEPKDSGADGVSSEEASHELTETEMVDQRDGETSVVYN